MELAVLPVTQESRRKSRVQLLGLFFYIISVQSLPPCQKRSSGVGSHQLFHRNNCPGGGGGGASHSGNSTTRPYQSPHLFILLLALYHKAYSSTISEHSSCSLAAPVNSYPKTIKNKCHTTQKIHTILQYSTSSSVAAAVCVRGERSSAL